MLCTFEHNIGNGAAMEITKHLIVDDNASPQLGVSLDNYIFLNSSIPGDTRIQC